MSLVTHFVPNAGGIQAFMRNPAGPVAHDMGRRAQRIRDTAVVNASGRPGPNVDTGRLRSSIHWRYIEDSDGVAAIVGTNVYYARYLEYGTDRAPPYPFLRPAMSAGHGTSYV